MQNPNRGPRCEECYSSRARCVRQAIMGVVMAFSQLSLGGTSATWAEESPTPMISLDAFRPESQLKVETHPLERSRFPVVDVHTHLGRGFRNSLERRDAYLELMDRCNVSISVNLDGRLGDVFEEQRQLLWAEHRDRFVLFAHIDWRGDGIEEEPQTWDCQRPDFARRIAQQLKAARERGASGLKLFKSFGLTYRDRDGTFLKIDDPRWDPIWQACGQLGLPVIMHTADPAAFFDPIDATNERFEELSRHPDWSFADEAFPRREDLLAARNRVIARHSQTVFIGAHLANCAEDLALVTQWLEKYPNLVVEITSRIGELGRQPYTARRFFLRFADRILFGTDGPKPELRMRLYFRFLETYDEYFPYSEKAFPPQGFWRIYGIGLPDDVLRKVYYANAARLIPGVRERLETQHPDLVFPESPAN